MYTKLVFVPNGRMKIEVVLRKLFGPRAEDLTGKYRKLFRSKEETCDLCPSTNISRAVTARGKKLTRYAIRVHKEKMRNSHTCIN
jgi:hypothetical protein